MTLGSSLIGKVFISHTSADKPFVRELADRLRGEGFVPWLDERELLPGDPLSKKIAEAVNAARVVLVVVSEASVRSRWLRYELNLAAERMIKGACRVIPIVIDNCDLPDEVRGLLYADCRAALEPGLTSIFNALRLESYAATERTGFWAIADHLVDEIFGGRHSDTAEGEYDPRDYEYIFLPEPDEYDNDDTIVTYESVPSYLTPAKPLNQRWWREFASAFQELPHDLGLVVTQRPIDFEVAYRHVDDSRVAWQSFEIPGHGEYSYVVFADVSNITTRDDRVTVLRTAREVLVDLARRLTTRAKARSG